MLALTDSPTIHKFLRYSAASAAGVVVSQVVLALCTIGLGWPGVPANITSVSLGAIPNYLINRHWTWRQRGQNRLWGEVIPFWVMALIGLLVSTALVAYADHRWDTPIAISLANLAGFGVLWIAKFVILDKVMWKVVHDIHPEVEVDPGEAGLPGVMDLRRDS